MLALCDPRLFDQDEGHFNHILKENIARFQGKLTAAEQKLLTVSSRVPINLYAFCTPGEMDQYAYNCDKKREKFKKVSEMNTLAECERAANLAMRLGPKIFHDKPPQDVRDIPIVIVGKVMMANKIPGIAL